MTGPTAARWWALLLVASVGCAGARPVTATSTPASTSTPAPAAAPAPSAQPRRPAGERATPSQPPLPSGERAGEWGAEARPPVVETSYQARVRNETQVERSTATGAGKGALEGLGRGALYGLLGSAVCGPAMPACAAVAIPAGAALGTVLGTAIGAATAPERVELAVRVDDLPPEPLRGEVAALLDRLAKDPAVLAAVVEAMQAKGLGDRAPRVLRLEARLTGRTRADHPARLSLGATADTTPGAPWGLVEVTEVLPEERPAARWAYRDGEALAAGLDEVARQVGAALALRARPAPRAPRAASAGGP